MNKQIKVGIVGVGLIAHARHIPNCKIQPDLFKLAAVCDLNEKIGLKVAKEFNAKYYKDVTQICKDKDVELLVIAVPGALHRDFGIMALENGKDVLMEKPVTLNTAQTEELITCAKNAGRKLFVHHNRRWNNDFLTVKKVLAQETLGDVFIIEEKVSKYSRVRGYTEGENIDWRLTQKAGGGRLNEWGTHLIDQMLLIADSKPISVFADLKNKCWLKDAEDHVNIMIKFESGLLGKIEISQSCRVLMIPRWYICGTKGTLMGIFGIEGETKFVKEGFTMKVGIEEGEEKEIPVEMEKPTGNELYQNIYEVIRNNAEPAIKLEQVRKVMTVVDAARKSNETGKVILL